MLEDISYAVGMVIGVLIVILLFASPFLLGFWFFVRRPKSRRAESPAPAVPTPPRAADELPPRDAESQETTDATASAPASRSSAAVAPVPAASDSPKDEKQKPQPSTRVAQATKLNGWVPPGAIFEISGYTIDAGLVYVGRRLKTGDRNDPSLIDPSLRVASRNPDTSGRWLDYWPEYSELHPGSRAAYLAWLASGRQDPGAPIGYVFLFMYGLERRAFLDIGNDPELDPELRIIRNEMSRLIGVYGDVNRSFQRYALSFVDALDMMLLKDASDLAGTPPDLASDRWEPPTRLLVQIGQYASDRQPVPVDWALAWAWYHPRTRIRTAATRCTAEFAAFFAHQYTARFGQGIVPVDKGPAIFTDYWAASGAITSVRVGVEGVKNVLDAGDRGALVDIVESAQAGLDAYSRYVGKRPDEARSLRAEALLPPELLELEETAPAFRAWLGRNRGNNVDAGELLAMWGLGDAERATKADSVLIAQLAHKLDFALEPDPRFGGPVYQAGSVVRVFGQARHAANTPSLEYEMATTAAHLAVAVGAADGDITSAEVLSLIRHVQQSLQLTPFEAARLSHHAAWLSAAPVKLSGLTKRINLLGTAQREALGDLMVEIALTDGIATPDEIRIVTRVFKLLGLDESSVTSRMHRAMAGEAGPVLVRHGRSDDGVDVPAPPAQDKETGFVLDPAAVERKRQDTASVSALLRDIFDDEEHPVVEAGTDSSPGQSTEDLIEGLDANHSRLARLLAAENEFDREWLDQQCQALGLLPDGALDTLNEASLELCEEPLVDGDGPYSVNPYALEELVR